MINYEDENREDGEAELLDFTCREVNAEGFTFRYYVIDTKYNDDPGNSISRKYKAGTIPTNIVLDDDMVIRYRLGEYNASAVRSIVNQLMQE
jgi:hypothetical protein